MFLKVQVQWYSFICAYLNILRYIYLDWRWINRAIILIPSCQHQPSYIVFIRKGDDVLECVVQGSVIMLQYICFVESHGAAQNHLYIPFCSFDVKINWFMFLIFFWTKMEKRWNYQNVQTRHKWYFKLCIKMCAIIKIFTLVNGF